MGKGDKKSRRGKITMGSHGVRRPAKKTKVPATNAASSKAKTVKSVDSTGENATAPKKVAVKKAAKKAE